MQANYKSVLLSSLNLIVSLWSIGCADLRETSSILDTKDNALSPSDYTESHRQLWVDMGN